MTTRNLGGIFVTADDPAFLERQVEPKRELVDLNAIDVRELRKSMLARDADYDTVPVDPEGESLRLYPGGVTIWSGFPGSGKTTLLRQLVVHLLAKQRGVFLASLEEDALDVFVGLARTALGSEDPSEDGLQWCVDTWAERLRLWHGVDQAESARLLAAIRVLGRQGVRHAVVDSLMCLDIHNSDWESQRQFANAMRATARSSGCHIHLVAHPRKLISSGQDPDLNDVAGAREIGGLADNVLFIRRAKDAAMTPHADATPMGMAILKQRHFRGALGQIDGWFQRNLRQFKADQYDTAPTMYLPHYAYEARQ
jgi:hypothetical protein